MVAVRGITADLSDTSPPNMTAVAEQAVPTGGQVYTARTRHLHGRPVPEDGVGPE